MIIDGEAVVTDRQPRAAATAHAAETEGRLQPEPRPLNDNAARADAVFLHRAQRPDLVFQGVRLKPAKRDAGREAATAAPSMALAAEREIGPQGRAAVGLLLACLATASAWSLPDAPPPAAPAAMTAGSTLGSASARTDAVASRSSGGKTNRITHTP